MSLGVGEDERVEGGGGGQGLAGGAGEEKIRAPP